MAKDEFRDDGPFLEEDDFDSEEDLDENEEELEDSEEEEDESEQDDIIRKITEVEKKANDAGSLAKILADPDVRALLEAKEKGRKVRLVDDVPEKKELEIPEPDLSGEDPETQQSLKKLYGHIRTALDIQLRPLKEQVEKMNQYVESAEGGKVREEIAAARKKYQDFDDYREDMIQINKANPGLSISELYYLAKARKTGGFGAPRPTQTERPKKTTARPAVREKKAISPGKKGFDALLEDALDNLDL